MIGSQSVGGKARTLAASAQPIASPLRHLNNQLPHDKPPEQLHHQTRHQPPNHRLYAHHSNATGAAKLLRPISAIIERVEGRNSGPARSRPERPPGLTPLSLGLRLWVAGFAVTCRLF
ncbi:hypothetical protein HBI81_064330 [Parastagonospora nodorum]|nr:hypothetical protein HBH53_035000 [Parastagonospora nodorum]KAH3984707.1 hypothetical protein HBH51_025130 [Parastagonospora nodorum]KAH4127085.1 hypothetical protein HBH47_044750 [Parastagonospora nodorum]KAH5205453.1 hypothetical protein HBH77_096650 [Parastagonospora nodorum]KAH5213786.1 hypothetical protein HBH68_066100 [Parastagonospora nodorum]